MTPQERKVMEQALEAYLCREMPAGTVIGDPKWWVPKIANAIKEALAQPEQERCVGCEACIDTACGRDECPKGWPKAAQPEQEPVEWGVDWGPDGNSVSIIKRLADGNIEVLAWEYAPHPSQRKPLTDEQITAFWEARPYFNDFARAIEAAHGITKE